MSYDSKKVVIVDYTNWRGERRRRPIVPVQVCFGTSQYHLGEQWFLLVFDCEDGALKDFALSGFHGFEARDLDSGSAA